MSVTHIGVREARRLQTDDGYTYVDVRSVPEYERGHPESAQNVPLLHFDPQTGQMRPNLDFLAVMQANFPSDAKLLIGCQVGGRSGKAALILADAGYAPVNVKGGFGGRKDPATGQVIDEGWSEAGLPVAVGA
ncbi:MAG: rhodanese-like domain-containing protein, partial [Vicinamibacterales bacterium]|nr:rhodanese-like domain-containing protein [Vicinamibacterales bacterium]